jgi:hypothetical protein
MGMELTLEQVKPRQLDAFIRHPAKAYHHILADLFANPALGKFMRMIADHERTLPAEARANRDRLISLLPETSDQSGGGSLKLMAKNLANSIRNRSVTKPKPKSRQFFLGKDWHALHYVLNGTHVGGKEPIARAILGGIEIPDLQGVMGYGPLRYLGPGDVRDVAKALDSVAPKQLMARLDKKDALEKKIYLARTFDTGEWTHLPGLFEGLREFYRDAAVRGNGLLLITN